MPALSVMPLILRSWIVPLVVLSTIIPAVALLSMMKELAAADLFADPGAGKVTVLSGRLEEVEKRLAVALAKFEADPESPTWADRVSQYDREKRALAKELAEARMEASNPLSGSWAEAVALMAADEPARLRAALLATVEGIWCVFVPRGRDRVAGVQVWFRGGARRDYLVLHKVGIGGAVGKRPASYQAGSLEAGEETFWDLRKQTDAAKAEKWLSDVDLGALAEALADRPGGGV
jgi:hypothetical protein